MKMPDESCWKPPESYRNRLVGTSARKPSTEPLSAILTAEVTDYQTMYPKSRIVGQSCNWAVMERGWWIFKTIDMIRVYPSGWTETFKVK
jgi:hypothetical protein